MIDIAEVTRVMGLRPGVYEIEVHRDGRLGSPCDDSWSGSTACRGRVRVEPSLLSDVRFWGPAD